MSWAIAICGLMGLSLTSSASGEDTSVPHLALDILTGDVAHAETHFASAHKITTFRYGRRVEAEVSDMVNKFRNCRFLGYSSSDFIIHRGSELFIFNCGREYNEVIYTEEMTDNIQQAQYYAEAVAPPPPIPENT